MSCSAPDMSVPSSSTRFSYRTNPEFSDITERVESTIYEQKFEGAAADIISRELGLADRQDTTLAPEWHCVILSGSPPNYLANPNLTDNNCVELYF
jgi:hypothetical protein